MCRIAGIVNFHSPPTTDQIIHMRDSMQHGGPDDAGIYLDDRYPLAFGFRRLSFLDLSEHGHQPMMDSQKQIVISFNGEIYNFKELRSELTGRGYSFQSTSDTEVIIYAYLHWGKQFLERLKGMFALAILDKRSNTLLLARDHAGIKPLYYYHNKDVLYFASEVRSFKTIKPNWAENQQWKKYFLLFGHLPEPVTTLEGVVPLPKGTAMEVQLDTLQATKWKFFTQYYNYPIQKPADAIDSVRETLTKAVEQHLVSDAPIGLFLSGGLDSTILTVLAKRFIPGTLRTLSIDFEDERYSEKYFQDVVVRHTGVRHQAFIITKNDFFQSLPDIVKAQDQPSNDGINAYFICKHAREYGLKAALSGIGSDEIFGGYPSFSRTRMITRLRWIPHFMFYVAGIFSDERIKKISFLRLKNALGQYLLMRGFFTPPQIAQLLDCTEVEVEECLQQFQNLMPPFIEKLGPIEKTSYLETNLYLQNQLLKDTDIMSMWHGLEVRVPFLDKALLELVFSIDPAVRYNRSVYKYLLVQAFQDVLPLEIVKRPKQGFNFPFGDWMKEMNLAGNGEDRLKKQLIKGKIHWSRYWSYNITRQRT